MSTVIIQDSSDETQSRRWDARLSSLLDVAWSVADEHAYHLARTRSAQRRAWHLERLQALATIRGRVEARAFDGLGVAA